MIASLQSPLRAQQGIRWQPALETAKRVAGQTNRLVLVHFWAEWCQPCAEMERSVFARPDVVAAVEAGFIPVKVNVDHFPATVRQYGVSIVPTDVVITADGQLVDKLIGLADSAQYAARLNQIAQSRSPQAGGGSTQLATLGQPEPAGYQQPALGSYQPSGYQAPGYQTPGYQTPGTGASAPSGSVPAGYGAADPPPHSDDRYQDYFNQRSQPAAASPQPAYSNPWAPPAATPPADSVGEPAPGYAVPASPYRSDSVTRQESAGTPPYGRTVDSPYQSPSTSPYQSPPTTPYQASTTTPYQSPTAAPYAPQSPPPYQPAETSPSQRQGYSGLAASPYDAAPTSPYQNEPYGTYPQESSADSPWRSPSAGATSGGPSSSSSSEPSLADQLPAGSPPLALDGFCPVRLAEQERWVRGDVRWGARHEGRTYLFAGPQEQQRFLATPQQFAPVLGGNDVVLAVEQGQTVPGRREHGAWYQGKVYLFSSESSYRQFNSDPERYIQSLQQDAQGMARRPLGSPSAGGAWQTYGSPSGGRY